MIEGGSNYELGDMDNAYILRLRFYGVPDVMFGGCQASR